MQIDELIAQLCALAQPSETSWAFLHPGIPNNWGQGRTVFGGLTGGLLHQSLSHVVSSDRSLRAFHTNFIGPVNFDSDIHIIVEQLRSGRNMSQYLARLQQDGNTCVCVQACFGTGRDSKLQIDKLPGHEMEVPSKAKFIPQIPKITPRFFRHFELAIEQGQIPFSWSKHSHYHGWMRFKTPVKHFNYTHLITLIDAWPPAVIQQLKLPAPVSTVSWDLELVQPLVLNSDQPWFGYQVDTKLAANGYAHTEATIWDEQSRVIALSRQTIAVFA